MEETATGRALRLEVVDEAGVRVRSAPVSVAAGWHGVEVRWDVGAAVTASGEAELFVDGSSRALLSGLATGQSLVDAVRVGAWDGSRNAGWIDFDDVAAARSGPIGSGGPWAAEPGLVRWGGLGSAGRECSESAVVPGREELRAELVGEG